MAVKLFYWYFRPIAIVAKLFGVLPLQNLHKANGKQIYFKYISVSQLYTTVMFFSVLFMFFYYVKFDIRIGGAPLDSWKIIVVYVMLTRSIICFTFCVHCSRKLPSLIRGLEQFDQSRHELLNTEQQFCRQFLKRSVLPFIQGAAYIMTIFSELNIFVRQILPEEIKDSEQGHIAGYIFGILGNWQIVPLLLYIYFAFTIKKNFQTINEYLAGIPVFSDCCNQTDFISDDKLWKSVENARCLYSLMSTAVRDLSNCYGNFMAVDQFCLNIMLVVNFYVFFFANFRDLHLVLSTLLYFLMVLTLIMVSHEIKENANGVVILLQNFRTSTTNSAAREEVQFFINQVAANPVHVSAAGYFVMDRNQIPSILSSVATYFIALVQFAPKTYDSKGLEAYNSTTSTSK